MNRFRLGNTLSVLPYVALVLAMSLPLATRALAREWASASGKFKVEADFVRMEGDKVILKNPNGELIPVDLNKLSDADRKHIETLRGRPTDSGKAKSSVILKGVDPDDSSLLVRAFFGFRSPDSDVALSPEGRFLAVASLDGGVQIADLVTGSRVFSYARQEELGTVSCLRFSPDGSKLVVGGKQGTIFVLAVASNGSLVEACRIKCAERQTIQSIAIASDNVTILAGVDESPLLLCRTDAPSTVATLSHAAKSNTDDVFACAFSRDGQTAYALSKERLYTIDTKAKTVQSLSHAMAIEPFRKPSFSADGSRLLVPASNKVLLWDVPAAKEIRAFPSTGTSIDGACFANGGANVVVITHGKVEVYKASGQQIATDSSPLIKTFNCAVSASDDGMYFAAAGKGQQALVFRVPDTK